MKTFIIKLLNKEFEILQDIDGKFILPNELKEFEPMGTGLKPAHEPILLARKPLSERNIAANVLKWGVGGINIKDTRIGTGKIKTQGGEKFKGNNIYGRYNDCKESLHRGRFPANLILECCCEDDELVEGKEIKNTGSFGKTAIFGQGDRQAGPKKEERIEKVIVHTNPNCMCRMLDEQSGMSKSTDSIRHNNQTEISGIKGIYGKYNDKDTKGFNDAGGCSRFFYQAKASQKERWFYCTICKQAYQMKERDKHIHSAPQKEKYKYLEFHPTQKPQDLICYLMRLITPHGGTIIDPFLGSGTGLIAAEREGFNAIGIDSKREYCLISNQRLKNEIDQEQTKLTDEQSTIQQIGF